MSQLQPCCFRNLGCNLGRHWRGMLMREACTCAISRDIKVTSYCNNLQTTDPDSMAHHKGPAHLSEKLTLALSDLSAVNPVGAQARKDLQVIPKEIKTLTRDFLGFACDSPSSLPVATVNTASRLKRSPPWLLTLLPFPSRIWKVCRPPL